MMALSARQRFHQTLNAMAQGDAEVVQRLRETCPLVSEELPDPEYRDLVDGTESWIMVVAMDWLPLLARLDMLQDLTPLINHLTTPQRRRRDHVIVTRDLVTPIQTQLLGQLRALWEAFDTVCAALIEVDARTLLQAEYPPLLVRTQRYEAQWAQTPRNEVHYETELATLTALWLRFCDPPPTPPEAQN